MRVTILDGYVDEPSNLGVPPFISPYPRYLAGAVLESGHEYEYLTIDQVRSGKHPGGDVLAVISGPIVPGKYLRGMPMSQREILQQASSFRGTKILGGSLARFRALDAGLEKAFDHVAIRDLDACVFEFLNGGDFKDRDRTIKEWDRWAALGAEVVKSHPDFPEPLVAELDASRGCVRYMTGGCSFCIEPMYGIPKFRAADGIREEVRRLSSHGVVNFRLGGMADFFSYMAKGVGESPTPTPNVRALDDLLRGIRSAASNLKVLHTDNADPAMIAAHPDQSMAALRLLVKYTTPGNTLSLGMESADPDVVERNNLNSTPETSLNAIRMINSVGAERGENGLPRLLPGLNFVLGLDGETQNTFFLNLKFLRTLLDRDLMIRRINIRQVNPVRREFKMKFRNLFRSFKDRVRLEIDHEMLKRVVPRGTILRNVRTEMREGKMTFGRQAGTYPLLVGLPYPLELGQSIDVMVTDHGQRSITAVEHPLDVNSAPMAALSAIPGIGMKRAARIVRSRPMKGPKELHACLDDDSAAASAEAYLGFPSG
jgi:radical SAM superfamily enzyme with C-terminal helix-hairpin-helix motif